MSRPDPRLGRHHHAPPPALTLWHEVALPLARAHEICGRARRTLALHLAGAGAGGGPVLWIAPRHGADALNPEGVVGLMPPQDILFVAATRPEDVLWTAEEALRSGVVPVVVADLPGPPGMVPVRRLHLAAEAGLTEGRCRPLCLLLTPGEGGAPGIETRWRMEPAHGPGRTRWRVERLRARMAPPRGWWLEQGRLEPGAGLTDEAVQAG
ncbi:ImuA family protein [Thetidibacter halocola]|uniref:Protein ImuA n=1 Tax=Thetidibacter halocola TaxID=2827239 RepID=A0A8J8B8D8_9RHOB|nr:hypothetical protein [Thetidibacter halocola]MBS0124654.1 hypothetical protein [Thetidibacter halocola]